jgi:hypothetical protein
MRAAAVQKEIRANSFFLVDESGGTRGGFVTKLEASLDLCDENVRIRGFFNVGKDGSRLDLRDENGKRLFSAPCSPWCGSSLMGSVFIAPASSMTRPWSGVRVQHQGRQLQGWVQPTAPRLAKPQEASGVRPVPTRGMRPKGKNSGRGPTSERIAVR